MFPMLGIIWASWISMCIVVLLLVSHSVMSDSVTSWTAAHQAPLSMGFSRQEYWNGLPFPSPGDLPNPGIKPWSPALQVDSWPSEPVGKPKYVYSFNQIWKSFGHYFLKHFLSSSLFSPLETLTTWMVGCLMLSHTHWCSFRFSQFLYFFCLILYSAWCYIFRFTNLFFCNVKCAINPIQSIFHLR